MGYNLPINGIYSGYNLLSNHLLTSWDIQVCFMSLPETNKNREKSMVGRWILQFWGKLRFFSGVQLLFVYSLPNIAWGERCLDGMFLESKYLSIMDAFKLW